VAVVERLEKLLKDSRTGLAFSQVMEHFKPSERLLVEAALTDLVESNLIEMKGSTITNSVFYPRPRLIEKRIKSSPTYELVLTAPEFMKKNLPESIETKKCVDTLIRQSKKELLVINPFLDTWLVEINEEGIRNLAKKGVDFAILTRNVRKNPEALKASLRLYELFATNAPDPNKLRILEFFIPVRYSRQFRHFTGLHAKVMISDKSIAYVGSANWTIESMSRNVEAGILTNDPKIVQHLAHLFELVAGDAIHLNLKNLYEKSTNRRTD